jgi:biotin carboxyl carrier protein
MEYEIVSPTDGKIISIGVLKGESINAGMYLSK